MQQQEIRSSNPRGNGHRRLLNCKTTRLPHQSPKQLLRNNEPLRLPPHRITALAGTYTEEESARLKTADVVVAVFLNKDKFLAEKRKPNEKIDPGIVCLPGGHVEPGETRGHALKREMQEELNVKIDKAKFMKNSCWTASNGEKQNVHYYLILAHEGKPTCRAAEKLSWTENIEMLDIEIDRQAVEQARAMLRQQSHASTPTIKPQNSNIKPVWKQ
jgi:8-oxo-dGTP diphosphatase